MEALSELFLLKYEAKKRVRTAWPRAEHKETVQWAVLAGSLQVRKPV